MSQSGSHTGRLRLAQRAAGVAAVVAVGFSMTACGLFGGMDAEAGDCVTRSSDPDEIEVVDCDSDDAAYEVTKRDDDPAGISDDELEEICADTGAVTALYAEDESWVLCLESV